jgi:hypothetical protein
LRAGPSLKLSYKNDVRIQPEAKILNEIMEEQRERSDMHVEDIWRTVELCI